MPSLPSAQLPGVSGNRRPSGGSSDSEGSDAPPLDPDAWPFFGRDPRNTSYAPDENNPTGTPEVAWTVDTRTSTANCSPVVVDGVVYTGSTGEPGYLYALDAETGEERWSYETPGFVTSAPAVRDNVLYVGTWGRRVYAIDIADGTERWTTDIGHRVGRSSPAVSDGRVILGTMGDGPMVVTGETEEDDFQACAIVALDTETGGELWRYDEFGRKENIEASPAVADATAYVGSYDGAMLGVDVTDGTVTWRNNVGAKIRARPTVSDGLVYVMTSGPAELLAFDAATGDHRWTADFTALNGQGSPAVANGRVYVACDRNVEEEADDDSVEDSNVTDDDDGSRIPQVPPDSTVVEVRSMDVADGSTV